MFGTVIWAVLDPVASLLGMVLWLRLWFFWARVSRIHPIVRLSLQLTQWLVGPLQRLLPIQGRLDTAALILSALVAVLHVLAMRALFVQSATVLSSPFFTGAATLLLLALAQWISWAVYVVMGVVLVQAVLSWFSPYHPLSGPLATLSDPLLEPIRRWLPTPSGFDLSPLVLLIVLQALLTVLRQGLR